RLKEGPGRPAPDDTMDSSRHLAEHNKSPDVLVASETAMDALIIRGGRKLSGRVPISGAKNAALPVMAATLLAPGVHRLRNVPLPGGCAWGPRPVNLHLEGLKAMGAALDIDHGYILGKDVKLRGARFGFDVVSVGATAQLMMAATLAEGTTVLENVALEPDIT